MLRVVVDTNVVVSGLLSPGGSPGLICRAIERGLFVWCMSDPLFAEYEGVLARPHLSAAFARNGPGLRQEFLAKLVTSALWADALFEIPAVVKADSDDDMVLATAIATAANLIVTGDEHLLGLRVYRNTDILTPRQFVEMNAFDLREGAA